jgi:hypothetical protein
VSIIHLVKDTDQVSDGVDGYLSRVAADYQQFKMYRTGEHELILDFIGHVGPSPLLVAFKAGSLIDLLSPTTYDRDDIAEAVAGFLANVRERFETRVMGEEEEDEEGHASFCGKQGCGRAFPHEHVEWRKKESTVSDGESVTSELSDF